MGLHQTPQRAQQSDLWGFEVWIVFSPAETSPIIQVYRLQRSFLDPHKLSHLMLPVKHCMFFLNYRVLLVLPCVRLFKIRWHSHDLYSGLGGWLGLLIQDNSRPFTTCSMPQTLRQQIFTVPGSWKMGWDVWWCCATGSKSCTVKKTLCSPKAAALHISQATCAWAGVSAVWPQECNWMSGSGMWPFTGASFLSIAAAWELCKCFPSVEHDDSMPLLSSC